jgi:hypothetical protein
MAWSWEFMMVAFKALGGLADNVACTTGARGSMLVPIDPTKPAGVRVPESLILPLSDCEIEGGRLTLKEAAAIGSAERSFLQNYLESFSPTGGHDQAVAFLSALNELPDDVRRLLSDEFGVEFPHGGIDERAQGWLLQRRLLPWRGKPALVPILEHAAHDPNARPFDQTEGIKVTGNYTDELGMLRFVSDPFGAFWRLGFPSAERTAFSLPMTLDTQSGRQLAIEHNFNLNARLGDVLVPDFRWDEKSIHISCLMVGSARSPKVSRAIFYRVMKEAGEADPELLFDTIQHSNRLAFLRLLEALEPHEGGLVPALRKVVRHQLEAMSWLIGTREL